MMRKPLEQEWFGCNAPRYMPGEDWDYDNLI